MPRRTGWSITATPTTARPWRWANPTPRPAVAACYDCHGYHDILPPSDPALASFENQHPGHLPAMSSRRHRRNSPNTSRTPIRMDAKNYPLLHVVFLAMTGLLIGTFSLLRPAHARVAGARGLSVSARLENVPRGENQDAGRTTNGSRASCRSSGSCISWSCRASCCWSSPACR